MLYCTNTEAIGLQWIGQHGARISGQDTAMIRTAFVERCVYLLLGIVGIASGTMIP